MVISMSRFKVLMKGALYSIQLVHRSSGLLILAYLVIAIINSTLPMISTFLLQRLIDVITNDALKIQSILFLIGLFIATIVITQFVASVQGILNNSIFTKASNYYEIELLEKINKLDISMLDTSSGKNIINDVRSAGAFVAYLPFQIIGILSLFYAFCVAIGVLLSYNVYMTLMFLLLTLPSIIMNSIYNDKSDELNRKHAPDIRKVSYYRWMLTDSWPAKDVRMYDLTASIQSRYADEKKIYINRKKIFQKKRTSTSLVTEFIMRCGEIVFTIFVIYSTIQGSISIGSIVLYVNFLLMCGSSFQGIASIFANYYVLNCKMLGRYFDFLSMQGQETNGHIRDICHFKSLMFKDVHFKYPFTDTYVLKGVTFTLNKGDKLSLVGINGSGKSTIIKLMLGLYEIESGEILINGYPMSDYDIHDVRKMFSALFQSFVQYPLSLRDNIALSDYGRAADDDAIIASLKQSGVYDELQEKLANGLDSYMTRQFDDKGTELSKGQWQKLALSRAYFKNAEIFIFDEPSAALDAEAEDRIFKNFESISEGKTGIMISHRISEARMSNKILVLDGGVITESGTHDELIEKNGLYAKLYNLQKEKYTAKEGA